MAKILVIDDEAVIREPIAASLRSQGYQVACAMNGRAALASIQRDIPDLILLDLRMPDMGGLSVLRDLRASPDTAAVPVLLLTASTEKEVIVQAASLGIHGYILKSSFSWAELQERVRRLLATPARDAQESPAPAPAPPRISAQQPQPRPLSAPAPQKTIPDPRPPAPAVASWPRILTRDQTIERLEQVVSGKTLAGVVAKLISVANSPDADLADVVRVIESDPILAARVLQLSHAASMGSRRRAGNIEDAARTVGVRGIQNMAISIGIFGAFPPDERDGFNTMRCWQHSYAVAELLNLLMKERKPDQESLNHLVGLCHDLCEILLRQHFAAEYEKILDFALTHNLPLRDVLRVALGIRQAELVSRLLSRMSLPPPVIDVIREFYERQSRENRGGASLIAQGLALADLAANGLLLTASIRDAVQPVTRTEWSGLCAQRPSPVIDPAAQRDKLLVATNTLARLPPQDECRLLLPVLPQSHARICYVRPPQFVEFDPLAFALALTCTLTISDQLPQPQQLHDIDGLLLVGMRPGVAPIIPADLHQLAAGANRPALPVLALVAQEKVRISDGELLIESYPITLEFLGKWLAATAPDKLRDSLC